MMATIRRAENGFVLEFTEQTPAISIVIPRETPEAQRAAGLLMEIERLAEEMLKR